MNWIVNVDGYISLTTTDCMYDSLWKVPVGVRMASFGRVSASLPQHAGVVVPGVNGYVLASSLF